MKVIEYSKLTKKKKDAFFVNLKYITESNDPAAANMWADDWQEQKHTLPYKLEKTSMFSNGNGAFYIIYDGSQFIACGGVYKSTFSDKIALAGTRTWVSDDYRNKHVMGYTLLPLHKQWAMDNDCNQVVLCFNDYNKNLIKIWKRLRMGEDRTPKTTDRIFSSNQHELNFPVTIQYTKQWVIYEKLDPAWDFDWSSIKYED